MLLIATMTTPQLALAQSANHVQSFDQDQDQALRISRPQISRYFAPHAATWTTISRHRLDVYGPRRFAQYDWKLNYRRKNGLCFVKNAIIRMKITYTLPRLENEKSVSPSFRNKWRQVYGVLRRHEQRHGRNYQLLARKLKSGLMHLKPQKSCLAIKRSGNRLDALLHRQDLRRNLRQESSDRRQFTRLRRRIERSSL